MDRQRIHRFTFAHFLQCGGYPWPMTYVDLSAQSAAAGGSPSLGGYLATPSGPGPFPAVLMIHEAFGLTDQIRAHADRLARAGHLTLAVDLFSDGGARRCLVSTMRSMMTGSGRVFTDLATARAWLAESPLSTGKTGVIGFCMGGGFALLVARDGFDAASVNYGRLPGDVEGALRGACPIVANFGGKDKPLSLDPPTGLLRTAGFSLAGRGGFWAGRIVRPRCRWCSTVVLGCLGAGRPVSSLPVAGSPG
ncbi:MAG: hypothetical protein NVS1B16_13650 [Pseudarthrobacter sp.]